MAHNEKVFVNVEPVIVVTPPDKLNIDISLAPDEQGDTLNTPSDRLKSDIPLAPDERGDALNQPTKKLSSDIPLAPDEQGDSLNQQKKILSTDVPFAPDEQTQEPVKSSTKLASDIPLAPDEQGDVLNQPKKVLSSEIPLAQDEKEKALTISSVKKVLSADIPLAQDDAVDKKRLVFRGGCNTAVPAVLLEEIPFSMIQNMRNKHPGLDKRKGQIKQHDTADVTNEVLSLYQFVKETRVDGLATIQRHLFAQMSDGDVLKATNNPPAVSTDAVFGSEVFNGSSNSIPASWATLRDAMIFSGGANKHQIYYGTLSHVSAFIVYKGDAAIPTIPVMGQDYTSEVSDDLTSTYAELGSLSTYAAFDCVFICTPVPVKQLNWTITTGNGVASVTSMYYWKNTGVTPEIANWVELTTGWADTTVTTGMTLNKTTGSMSWTQPTDAIPHYMFGRNGYWLQLRVSVQLGATVNVTGLTFEADWSAIENIWDGVMVDAISAEVYIAAVGAVPAIRKSYAASSITVSALKIGDTVTFNTIDNIVGFYVNVGSTPNTTADLTMNNLRYWNGTEYASIGALGTHYTDGTYEATTLAKSGYVPFARQSAAQKRQIGTAGIYAYSWQFTVSGTLSTNLAISIKTLPWFDITEMGLGICNCAWKGRMVYAFDRTPEYIYITPENDPQNLNGTEADIKQVGDGRPNRIVAIKQFHNELLVFQEEKGTTGGCITLVEGYSKGTYGMMAVSSNRGTLNSKCVEVVDGIMHEVEKGKTELRTVAFFLSHYGVYRTDGRTCVLISNDIRNYFDPTAAQCIVSGQESHMWLKYNAAYHTLEIGLVSGSGNTCNKFPIYDLQDGTWSFDVRGQPLSCMANIETASATGALPILQVGGGVEDGTVYQLNTTTNDVDTAIDAFALVELDGQGDYINLREIALRLKSGSGACTMTPTVDSVDGTPIVIS